MLMVGTISISALAAVGMSMQFMMIINIVMTLYVVGGNALISRFIGQGRTKRASALLYQLTIFAICISFFVTITGFVGAESFYGWMGAQPSVIQDGASYFKIISLGIVLIFMDNLFYNALSAAGDAKNPFYIKIVSTILHAFLNYCFIFGHFGFIQMGIDGAAYATLISYLFSVVAYVLLLKKQDSKLTIVPLIRKSDFWRVMRVGWSAALDRGLSSFSFLLFVSIITAYGTAQIAGYQVGLRIEGVAFMPGFGFAIAASALVGQSLGAKNHDHAYRLGIISGRIAYIFMGSIGVMLVLFSNFFVEFFTHDAAVVAVASQYLILVGLAQIPLAIMFVYSGALRGAGATKTTLKINIFSLWVFRLIPSFIAYKLGCELWVIFAIMNIETLIKGIIYVYIYKKRVWLSTEV